MMKKDQPFRSENMQHYTTEKFGHILQSNNRGLIVCISWEIEDVENPPLFHFFPSDIKEIAKWFHNEYTSPFVYIPTKNYDNYYFTRKNSIIMCDDSTCEIIVIYYKTASTVYKFFADEYYLQLKHELSIGSISWDEFSS